MFHAIQRSYAADMEVGFDIPDHETCKATYQIGAWVA
jgi:hypothetical protein